MAGWFPGLRIETHEPAPRLDQTMDSRACEKVAAPESKVSRWYLERPFDIGVASSTISDHAP